MRSTSAPASFHVDQKKTNDIDEEMDIIESLPIEEQVISKEQLSSTLIASTTESTLTNTHNDEDEKRNVSNTSTLSSIM
jgi:hypothetical protein